MKLVLEILQFLLATHKTPDATIHAQAQELLSQVRDELKQEPKGPTSISLSALTGTKVERLKLAKEAVIRAEVVYENAISVEAQAEAAENLRITRDALDREQLS